MMRKIWSSRSWDEYLEWQNEDKRTLRRINAIIKDIERNGPMDGIGKPERLSHHLSGWYSRRIDDKHRLVYRMVSNDALEIAQCKGHYDD